MVVYGRLNCTWKVKLVFYMFESLDEEGIFLSSCLVC